MSIKVDRKNLMRNSLTAERKTVQDRFAAAEAVLAERPGGLAVAPSATALSAPATRPAGPAFTGESRDFDPRRVIRAPIAKVHDNPLNARHIYDPDVVKEKAASMATHGQKVPALAIYHSELSGEYTLIDGHYRKKGLVAAGIDEIDLLIVPDEGALALYRQSWMLNEERNAQSALDNAFAWRILLERGLVKNETQIAELLGVSGPTVNKTMAMLALPAQALDKMRERPDRFGVVAGYELTLAARKLEEPELLQLVDRIISEELSSKQVAAIRSKLDAGQERKRKENSRQYKIQADGAQIGSLKEWDSGKVTLEVILADPKDRAVLVTELRARFGLQD